MNTAEEIALYDLTKVFRLSLRKVKVAVNNITFAVPRGEIVGLLGPNGSGKSTTLKMILGFLKPTSGQILVCGESAESRSARRHIGYLPENPRFQRFLPAKAILKYLGGLLGMSGAALDARSDELLDLVGLRHAAHERVQGFSKGMTQRLAIAQALLNQPKILIFDEPMSGLDPLGRMEIRKLIATVHGEMKHVTIFFSSHILADVEALCSYVILLKNGELKTAAPIDEILFRGKEGRRFEVTTSAPSAIAADSFWAAHPLREFRGGWHITFAGSDDLTEGLDRLKEMGATVWSVTTLSTSLEKALFEEDRR